MKAFQNGIKEGLQVQAKSTEQDSRQHNVNWVISKAHFVLDV